jgi:hypothetical protein
MASQVATCIHIIYEKEMKQLFYIIIHCILEKYDGFPATGFAALLGGTALLFVRRQASSLALKNTP